MGSPQRQGRRHRGGQSCPAPPFEISVPPFHVWHTGCCIHPILYFKNVGPPAGFRPSLLLNPVDGPAQWFCFNYDWFIFSTSRQMWINSGTVSDYSWPDLNKEAVAVARALGF